MEEEAVRGSVVVLIWTHTHKHDIYVYTHLYLCYSVFYLGRPFSLPITVFFSDKVDTEIVFL